MTDGLSGSFQAKEPQAGNTNARVRKRTPVEKRLRRSINPKVRGNKGNLRYLLHQVFEDSDYAKQLSLGRRQLDRRNQLRDVREIELRDYESLSESGKLNIPGLKFTEKFESDVRAGHLEGGLTLDLKGIVKSDKDLYAYLDKYGDDLPQNLIHTIDISDNPKITDNGANLLIAYLPASVRRVLYGNTYLTEKGKDRLVLAMSAQVWAERISR